MNLHEWVIGYGSPMKQPKPNVNMKVTSKVEFTNIKCTSLDKTFSEFEYCHLKSVNRSYKYFSTKVKLHKIPITSVKVNVALLKRLNGYKPFLYNITFDACKFMASKNRNPVISFFYSMIGSHSNMNHNCPYNHDLIWDKITINDINHHFLELLPFPEGDYSVYAAWYAYGILRADIQIFGTLS
ncbi:uncharacterized protein Dwil_GK27978 [Drosophila willistoni]|uniref:MD-2-related lipid-recognition domain-containing protein n=1 Tax=Drosophila willistoni TaxID=7260 RepID=A0A0Q9X141_DROWI|nr:uncharacterized protein Dwil_GK27978 [Drosophila willistoni]